MPAKVIPTEPVVLPSGHGSDRRRRRGFHPIRSSTERFGGGNFPGGGAALMAVTPWATGEYEEFILNGYNAVLTRRRRRVKTIK